MQPIETPARIGRRIVTWGDTGSGKTTFTSRLGAILGIEVVQMDSIRHERGWDSVDWPEFRERLTVILDAAEHGWVTDGSYSRVSDVYLSRADTLVWLHMPWRTSFWRLFKRTVRRAWTKEPLYHEDGPRESWRLSFASNKSILWWSISHRRQYIRNTRTRIAALSPAIAVHELTSAAEVEAFLSEAARLKQTAEA